MVLAAGLSSANPATTSANVIGRVTADIGRGIHAAAGAGRRMNLNDYRVEEEEGGWTWDWPVSRHW